jgi:hypothetical protein
MIHLLWECENVQILLEAIDNWTLKNGNFTLNYNKKTFTWVTTRKTTH